MHGLMIGLAYLPYAIVTGQWTGFLLRCVAMAVLMGVLCAISGDDDVEEQAIEDAKAETKTRPIRLAIVGRPNAGKSTLINQLVGEDRMLTGPEAGITRDSVTLRWTWEGREVRLVDTAGLRRKSKVQERLERMREADGS